LPETPVQEGGIDGLETTGYEKGRAHERRDGEKNSGEGRRDGRARQASNVRDAGCCRPFVGITMAIV